MVLSLANFLPCRFNHVPVIGGTHERTACRRYDLDNEPVLRLGVVSVHPNDLVHRPWLFHVRTIAPGHKLSRSTLVVHDRLEFVEDFYEVLLVIHHDIKVFITVRVFVQ